MGRCDTQGFTQTDPLQGDPGDPFMSAYVYGNNNPAVFTDPSGLRGQSVLKNPVTAKTNVEKQSFLRQILSQYKSGGPCVGVSAGLGWSGQGAVCVLRDKNSNRWYPTASVGFGSGFEASLTGGGVYSNAPRVSDMYGKAACEAYGYGAVSFELCEFLSSGSGYLSVYVGGGPSLTPAKWFDTPGLAPLTSKSSGHITYVNTYPVQTIVDSTVRQATEAITGTKDAFKSLIDDIPSGGRQTRGAIRQIKCMLFSGGC